MLKTVTSPLIDFKLLTELEQGFQKNLCELIDLYIKDAQKKIEQIKKSQHDNNFQHILSGIRELRNRSMDIGAIKFSFQCLSLELAVQERRSESIPNLLAQIIKSFDEVHAELHKIKTQLQNR